MNDTKKIIGGVFKYGWKGLFNLVIIILLYRWLAFNWINISLVTILLTVFNLLTEDIQYGIRPDFKHYFTSCLYALVIVFGFIFFMWLAGSWGLIGLAIMVVGLAAWRIYASWDYYNYTCWWISQRLKGNVISWDYKPKVKP